MKKSFDKRVFSYLFICLLFVAEIFSVPCTGIVRENVEQGAFLGTISFGETNADGEAFFTAGIHRTGHHDIEINRNLENISSRVLSTGKYSHSYKQNRRIQWSDRSVFEISSGLFALRFYRFFCFMLLGACFSFSLRFIIKYIHHKNGEKIDRVLSERHFTCVWRG